jgi:hypothetical protein
MTLSVLLPDERLRCNQPGEASQNNPCQSRQEPPGPSFGAVALMVFDGHAL